MEYTYTKEINNQQSQNQDDVRQERATKIFKESILKYLQMILSKPDYLSYFLGQNIFQFFGYFCIFAILKQLLLVVKQGGEFENSPLQFWNTMMTIVSNKFKDQLNGENNQDKLLLVRQKFKEIIRKLRKQSDAKFIQSLLENALKELISLCEIIFSKEKLKVLEKEIFDSRFSWIARLKLKKYLDYKKIGCIINYGVIMFIFVFFGESTQLKMILSNLESQLGQTYEHQSLNKFIDYIQVEPQKYRFCTESLFRLVSDVHYKMCNISFKNDIFGFRLIHYAKVYSTLNLNQTQSTIKEQIDSKLHAFSCDQMDHFFCTQNIAQRILHQNEHQEQIFKLHQQKCRKQMSQAISKQEFAQLQRQLQILKQRNIVTQ